MDVPRISSFVLYFFRGIVRGYFRRHFTAVRLSRASDLHTLSAKRLILYANHSSWWDPMVSVLLAEKLMPTRKHYAPMDADSLERYPILKQIGIFGVDMNSLRGAAKFLRGSLKILAQGGVLWITPQGRFVDPRQRPLAFKPGMATLAARVPDGCTLQPIAIEYVFWNERLPGTLLHFGEPVYADGRTAVELQEALEAALVEAMDELKQMAMARSTEPFTVLKRGRVGTGGFYALGQRTLAFVRRRKFQAEHTISSPVRQDEHG